MKKNEKCMMDIIKYLVKRNIQAGVYIYINNKRYSIDENGVINIEENKNPKDFFEYNGDFLSMSFEGDFYNVMNYSYDNEIYQRWNDQFEEICNKYGKYYEMGDSWNLSLYEQ